MLNEISLPKFLSRYCNLTGGDLAKLTHEDVKEFFPEIERSTFESIRKDPSLTLSGKVLLVNDGKKVIPYYAPVIDFSVEDEPMHVRLEKDDTRIVIDRATHDYTKMSIPELKLMLRHKFNSRRNQRNARIELESRGVVLSRKYDRNKEKRKVEEIKDERD